MGRTTAFVSLFLGLLLLAPRAFAQEPASPAPVTESTRPARVHIGVYLLRIDALDLKAETATITFYVWTRWRGDIDGAAFEVVNGSIESKDMEYLREQDGVRYAYYRVRATVNVAVDFHRYPFDEHRLELVIEHSEADTRRVVFVVDRESMRHLEGPQRSGWIVHRPTYEIATVVYRTNWGMIGVGPDDATESSRFSASLRLEHAAGATFLKTFLTLFISMLITFLAFVIHPEELEARVGVGVAGIFGAVSSYSVLSENLPEISYMTLADKIHALSLFFVFTTLLASAYAGHLARKEQVERALRVDRRIGIGMSVTYAVLVACAIALA